MKDELLAPEDEVILDESVSDDERIVRVYDSKGDFNITVPAGAKITFGYFNPSNTPGGAFDQSRGGGFEGRTVAKQTALRIYEHGEKGNQLACFLGVSGFRDTRIKLTRMSQKLIVETNFTDDGEGGIEFGGKQQRQLIAAPEPDTYQ
jgi:hypothetical protein